MHAVKYVLVALGCALVAMIAPNATLIGSGFGGQEEVAQEIPKPVTADQAPAQDESKPADGQEPAGNQEESIPPAPVPPEPTPAPAAPPVADVAPAPPCPPAYGAPISCLCEPIVCCPPPPPVSSVFCLQPPCSGCVYHASVCVPACCAGQPPCISWRSGFLGRKIATLCWDCCGHRVEVVVTRRGHVRVRG